MGVTIFFSLLFIGIGLLVLVDTFVYRYRNHQNRLSWNSTIAKRDTNMETHGYFYTVDGVEYSWHPPEQHYELDETAEEMEIIYNPENPEQAMGYNLKPLWSKLSLGLVLVGVGAGIFVFLILLPNMGVIIDERVIGTLAGALFASVGLAIFIGSLLFVLPNKNKKIFNESTAVCIKHLVRSVRGGHGTVLVTLPVFEYEANGVTYQMAGFSPKNKVYSNFNVVPAVGETKTIWINPENPRDAFVDRGNTPITMETLFTFVLAISFFVMGVFAMYMMLTR